MTFKPILKKIIWGGSDICPFKGITPVEEVHHIVPISRGGTHAADNLMSLCQSCHNKIHHDLGDR